MSDVFASLHPSVREQYIARRLEKIRAERAYANSLQRNVDLQVEGIKAAHAKITAAKRDLLKLGWKGTSC